uniref:RecQ mediated genome instability protein 1 OB-fold domain-containing protein n=1 Tax=Pavo cristatus TaxID=9049 RepID=A0A8C9G4D4_PAVCR
ASSLNTPPGTKIKLSGIIEVRNGFLLLDDSNTAVLGGEVEHLIEKWELQRLLMKMILLRCEACFLMILSSTGLLWLSLLWWCFTFYRFEQTWTKLVEHLSYRISQNG